MRLLRLEEVKSKTGLCRSSIYQGSQRGTFPKQVTLGSKTACWVESEVDAWVAGKVAARDQDEGLRIREANRSAAML
jgi:prophage regulatory protein